MSEAVSTVVPKVVYPEIPAVRVELLSGPFILNSESIIRVITRINSFIDGGIKTEFILELNDELKHSVEYYGDIGALPFVNLKELSKFTINVLNDDIIILICYNFIENNIKIATDGKLSSNFICNSLKLELIHYRPWYRIIYNRYIVEYTLLIGLFFNLSVFAFIITSILLSVNKMLYNAVYFIFLCFNSFVASYSVFNIFFKETIFSKSIVMFGQIGSREESIAKIRRWIGGIITLVLVGLIGSISYGKF